MWIKFASVYLDIYIKYLKLAFKINERTNKVVWHYFIYKLKFKKFP